MTFPAVIRKLDDWMNPIAVKEMRQAVNGRIIVSTLMFFFLANLAIAASILLYSELYGQGFSTGRNVFMGHLSVLLATCLFYVPVSTAIRFSSERTEQNVDLFFITTLQPIQIVWGKTLAATLLMLLFFSAAAPFMTMTYMLRGLDIPSIFILLAFDFLVVGYCVQVGILLACVPGKVISRALLLPVGLAVLVIVFISTMQGSYAILYLGVGSSVGSWDFWGPALTVAGFAVMAIGLLFIFSVTLMTPRSANRALGVRIYLLFIWLASGIIAGVWSFVSSADEPVQAWMLGMTLMFCVMLFVSICERQELGPRVLRAIPKRKILRLPAFFLYSGAASGISYSILMITATILLATLFLEMAPSFAGIKHSHSDDYLLGAIAFALYAIGYSLTALSIKRFFFPHSQRSNIMTEITLTLLLAGNAIPVVIAYALYLESWENLPSWWYLGNPLFVILEKNVAPDFLPFIGIWAVICLAVTLPWLRKQFLNFRPAAAAQMNVLKQSDE